MENSVTEIKPLRKRENPWVNLGANLVIPTIIMVKFSDDKHLGPVNALFVALALPIALGLYDLLIRRNLNMLSILGFTSVLLTGGIGLLRIGGIWFAVKEALIPAVIGIAIIVSHYMKRPLVKAMFLNEQIIQLDRVKAALEGHERQESFERLLTHATYLISISFFLSSIINFVLAWWIVVSPPGSEEFTKQVGTMNAVSFPVIMIACTSLMLVALWRLVKGIERITGLQLNEILKS